MHGASICWSSKSASCDKIILKKSMWDHCRGLPPGSAWDFSDVFLETEPSLNFPGYYLTILYICGIFLRCQRKEWRTVPYTLLPMPEKANPRKYMYNLGCPAVKRKTREGISQSGILFVELPFQGSPSWSLLYYHVGIRLRLFLPKSFRHGS